MELNQKPCSLVPRPRPPALDTPLRANCHLLSHPPVRSSQDSPPGGQWLYPMGGVLDLTDHGLGISLEWAGDHDEADELEIALQGLPLDLPGLWMDTPGP